MAKIAGSRCDGCGRQTLDYLRELGWLRFENCLFSGVSITMSLGRDASDKPETAQIGHLRDFCSVSCLTKKLRLLGRARTKKSAKSAKKAS